MNVLLIYPEFPDTFWSFRYALEFVRKRAPLPPLGLLTIASMLPPEWSRRLVDVNVTGLKQCDLNWADCVFISAMSVQRQSAQQLISRCKKEGLRVVVGGPLFLDKYEQFPEVDHFILNEAELTLPGFLEDLAANHPQRIYSSSQHADMHQTPNPQWDLLNLKHYSGMSVQFSRGCPFNCDFCTVTAMLGHRVRIKTSDQIITELNSLYELGWRDNVFFVDDNFIGNKAFLKNDLLPALIAWRKQKPGMTFYTEASINLADEELLMQMMVEAGFNRVFVGIETPDDKCLSECRKLQNENRDLLQDVKRIQQAGLEVQGGFIVGFDNDHSSIFKRQIDFIQRSGIVTAMVGLLQAFPGTGLYERMKKEGRLCGFSSGDNVDGSTNFHPIMKIETLLAGYREILLHIYSPKYYYQRIKTYLKNIGHTHARTQSPVHYTDIYALILSFWRLGVLGRERFHYWRLLTWTLFHRPRLMNQTITFAIYGYHFRKMCDCHIR